MRLAAYTHMSRSSRTEPTPASEFDFTRRQNRVFVFACGLHLNRNAVGKVTYQVGRHTSIQLTAYNATMSVHRRVMVIRITRRCLELSQANGIIGSATNNFTLENGAMTACSASTIAA